MYDSLVPEAWSDVLASSALVLTCAVPGLLGYGYLMDLAVFEARGRLRTLRFGPLDVGIGSMLAGLFVLLTVSQFRFAAANADRAQDLESPASMIAGAVVSSLMFLVVIGGILTSLTVRRIPWRDCFSPVRLGPPAVLGRALGLIALALPLIVGVSALARVLLAAVGYVDDSPQDIVSFLADDRSRAARWVVAIFAVVVAPMEEEFLFRGYLYGIMRRFAGPAVGIFLNAALFAAIHAHLPSFGGLFVLAVCLTLAYEWSGSLFVPMAMHAIFNLCNVVELFTGGLPGS